MTETRHIGLMVDVGDGTTPLSPLCRDGTDIVIIENGVEHEHTIGEMVEALGYMRERIVTKEKVIMARTMADLNKDMKETYGTKDNTYEDFPVDSRVKIITACQDFSFFYGETGKVIENKGTYLGITVKYDEPRHYQGGGVQTGFNFNPDDIVILDKRVKEIALEQKRLEDMNNEEKAKEEDQTERSKRFEIMDY